MFTSFYSFAPVFLILSVALALLVIFKEQCLALEDKFDAWWVAHKSNKLLNIKFKE